ncbi:MAG: hypothetical protein J0I60_04885 [Nitrosospira sp.]|nr:hypothetical protein [Nitrosospira sp.]
MSKQYKRHTGRSRYPVAFETSYLPARIVFFGQINNGRPAITQLFWGPEGTVPTFGSGVV